MWLTPDEVKPGSDRQARWLILATLYVRNDEYEYAEDVDVYEEYATSAGPVAKL